MNRALCSMVLAALAAPAFAQQEQEPNNSAVTANPVVPGFSTTAGVLAGNSDHDWYTFTLAQPGALRIACNASGDDTCNTLDVFITLFNASMQQVAADDDSGPAFFCSLLEPERYPVMGNLPAGQYYLKVNQLGSVAAGDYNLTVSSAGTTLQEKFTYQGVLKIDGAPVNGPKDLTVSVWVDATTTHPSMRVGLPIHFSNYNVVNGLVNLPLDFGPDTFKGLDRFLQIEIADAGAGPGGAALERVKIAASPNAIFALKAKRAETAALADRATNADLAENANFAGFATTAQSAWSATSADAVAWASVTGKPSGFADGIDDDGPWSAFNPQAIYCPTGSQVAIATTNFGGFTLAVNGTAGKPGGGSWSVFCDSRLKNDIKPLSGTLDRLMQLRGYSFRYKDEAIDTQRALPGTQLGLLAEEVETVFPDWVERDPDGYRYVTERATTALMVEGLRDLRAEKDAAIAAKQQEIDALTRRLADLEARLLKIEQR